MIGKVIEGKYRIDRKIGRGGFGDVYQGCDLNLKRDIAVKVLSDPGKDDAFRKRFLRESEAMARLMHPNIVTVFDFGEYEGRPFLVLELVNGPSLMELAEKTSLSLDQTIKIALQICQGMAYAHDNRIIHRDLSLKNIMVDDRENVKILDFGLAKVLGADLQTTGEIVGTPYYLAPEQISGEHTDQRVDIFAVGVGLFRLVNGRFPFEAEHPASVVYQIMNERNLEFLEGVPQEVRNAILKCLEKNPEDRYRDFREIEAEIGMIQRTCLDSTAEVHLKPISYVRNSRRNPYLNRVMIKNPSDFFGRSKEVKRIYSRLDAAHPQSISIVGDRRIGKSSLLNYVYNRKNRKQSMRTYGDSIFIYVDLQRSLDLTVPKFIDLLLGMFSYEEGGDLAGTSMGRSLDDLKNTIQAITAGDRRVIILMDEFESITRNKSFDMQFFSFLRFLANNFKVAYVTSSYLDLQRLCHNKDVADSPFFNIFSNLPLRPFSHDEALDLITAPSEREGIPLGRYAPSILEISGYFPLYIQIACSSAFEFLVENRDAEPRWKEIALSFKEEIQPHYSFVWEKLDATSKETMCRVAMGKKVGNKYRYVIEDLMRRGYLREEDGRLRVFSSTFGDFVLEQSHRIGRRRPLLSSLWPWGIKSNEKSDEE